MSLLGTAATLGLSIALPAIMKKIGLVALPALAKKAMSTAAIPAIRTASQLLASKGLMAIKYNASGAVRAVTPAVADRLIRTGVASKITGTLPATLRIGASSVAVPNALSQGLDIAGKGIGTVGSTISGAIPWLLHAGSRATQGAGTAAGALVGGASDAAGGILSSVARLPQHLSLETPAQIARYGRTPTMAMADMLADLGGAAGSGVSSLGNAAGLGISALTGAVGSVGDQLASSMRMADVQRQLHNIRQQQALDWQGMGLDPQTARIIEQSMRGTRPW